MSSRRRRQKKGLVSDINVVPYIDVMLVLLVIFMVTAPMLTSGVTIELPEASTEPMNIETNEEPLIVSVRTNGELFINVGGEETSPVTLGVVKDRVMKVLAARPQTQVQLRGDTRLDYGTLMQVMSALQDAGVVSIGLVAEAP
ncbi:MAG: protein TolR [Litorivicinaceae bacterium]|jgi:biopolymer transport protein TolR|nr:protein TolR [Litorivicinaceae bacterium]MDP5329496.1 protein TolR [Litorivicinaceae bacterium]MDP5331028.1 protein TolR [Litorivicinaceae bacterium]MDP5342696.1 protein TolR [Litorivicinaceae bacterium]MDP5344179.1 protein TolR [Litorivicinaceae bacterium]